jgi:two-component sensor histidine kinase/CheY-like chemotaxis protein
MHDWYRGDREAALQLEGAETAEQRSARRSAEAEHLLMAQEIAGLGVFFRNYETGEAYWSDKQFEIRGFDPRYGVPSLEQSRSFMHHEGHNLPVPNLPMAEPGTKETRVSLEIRVRHAQTNREIWIRSKRLITFNSAGHPATMIGVDMDVTAEKKAIEDIQQSEQRQRLLAREVDHRAKNILATVLSVVRLTRADSIDDFRSAVEHRIAALARVHSILADQSWAGASLRDLIQGEISAFDGANRCSLDGPDLGVAPTQVQAVSLILHELTTNAAKYGALSQPAGAIRITWSEMKSGGVLIEWSERGCHNVTAPSRRGFGSRLIAATLGHQIEGDIKTIWRPEGVLYEIFLGPAAVTDKQSQHRPAKTSGTVQSQSISGKRVLIVEDEALIALSLEEMLQIAGCDLAELASNVDESMSIIENQPIDMAILDFNLGGETSLPIAHALRSRGVPFTFLTGYNFLPTEAESICSCNFIKKPTRQSDFDEALFYLAKIKQKFQ